MCMGSGYPPQFSISSSESRNSMKNALFLSLLLTLLILLSLPSSSLSAKCNAADKKVLLQIQRALSNGDGFLSWIPEIGCCDWYGVDCDVKTDRVIGLVIQYANFSGQIPAAISDLPYLQSLTLHKLPNLFGPIPSAIAKITSLNSLWITWTNLSGPVPPFLGQLKNLTYLNLQFNNFSGSIPPTLSELPNLEFLRLDRNKLTGKIPESFGKFTGRSMYLYLSHNQLTGTIPRSFSKINFIRLDVSRNRLEGDISFLFGTNKTTLETVDFSRNMFEFDLSKVEFPQRLIYLDLNHNKIFGSIPVGLTGVELQTFNVSYNRLCGQIPSGGRLQGFEYTEYFHNKCLCGAPLPPCK